MRIGIIADIHGNVLALQAVLVDLSRRGVSTIVNLGDSVSGPLWPRETLELLIDTTIQSVRGNHDRWVSEGTGGQSDQFARGELDDAQLSWLGRLPARITQAPGIVAFHGRPDDDNAYLLEDVSSGRLLPASNDSVTQRLAGVAGPLILCGHSHQAAIRRLDDGRIVVNPGSVGCPAYDDPTPPNHVSEAGSPFARYAVAHFADEQLLGVDLIAVTYDNARAAARAASLGREEWSHALRTGRVPASHV